MKAIYADLGNFHVDESVDFENVKLDLTWHIVRTNVAS